MTSGRIRLEFPRPSSAIQLLIGVNVGVMLLSAMIGPTLLGEPLTAFMAMSWDGLFSGYGLGLLRLISYQFAHADLMHLLFNMIVLYVFSRMVAADTGDRGLVHLYLVGGMVGAVCQLLLGAASGMLDSMLVLGASGAVYAVMVYAACMAPRQEILLFFLFPIQLRWLVTFLVLAGVYMSFNTLHGMGGGTADAAHLGGALWGFVGYRRFRGYYLAIGHGGGRLFPGLARWRADRATRQHADLRAEMDRLLEKVHQHGMGALTSAERKTLERASRDMKRR